MCVFSLRSSPVLLGLMACFGVVQADEPVHDHDGIHCLKLNMISTSDVLDEQHLLFRMKNNDLFLNTLTYACPGLAGHRPFMYRTSVSELCDLDIITVLDDMGFGLQPGASCGLGLFKPIKQQELDDLKARIKERRSH
jgi:hypothetical protein